MAVNIVTGMTGIAHITSDDDRAKNASIFGTGKYVMDYGKKFETSILSNNQIRIRDGMCINQGTQMGIEPSDYEDVIIENGVSGSKRNDLIVMRYERNADTSIEKASLVVIKGTAGTTATDPSYNSGNILDGGELIDDMPLYRVKIESLTIIAVEPLFVVFDYSHRKALVGLSNVDNTSDLKKPLSIATQKAIDELNTGIQSLDKKVTTNLLKPTLATTTQNGVTCTNNGDGTYTLNGTASTTTLFYLISSKNALGLSNFIGKKLKLLGNPVIGNENCRLLAVNTSWGADANDVGNGSVFTLAETTKKLYIEIKSGFTCDNLVFKPMITTNLNATYDDFVPYTGDTGQLNSDVADIAEVVNNLGDASYKGVSTSVTSGDTNLVTGDAISKAIFTATNYEEGTFTPVFYNGSTKVQTGAIEASYKKIGNLVYIFISNMWNGSFPKITSIKGLPFSAVVTNNVGSNVLNGCHLYSNVSGTNSNEYIDSYISKTEMTVSLSGKSSVNVAVLSVCGIYKIS